MKERKDTKKIEKRQRNCDKGIINGKEGKGHNKRKLIKWQPGLEKENKIMIRLLRNPGTLKLYSSNYLVLLIKSHLQS